MLVFCKFISICIKAMIENTQKLTKEFCTGKVLIFYPRTEEEAADIQRQLFRLGFAWLRPEQKVQLLTECVQEGMMVDETGRLFLHPTQTAKDRGLLCTLAQFDVPTLKDKLEKIDADFFKGRVVCFKPRSAAQAEAIQEHLFKLGFEWCNTGIGIWQPETCVNQGFHVRGKNIYTGSAPKDSLSIEFPLDDPTGMPGVSDLDTLTGNALVREVFNRLSARIDTLEKKIDAIHAETQPKKLPKSPFKK